ncbi:MAG: hypothetical protein AAF363_19110 [Bacteroidota bacterium]
MKRVFSPERIIILFLAFFICSCSKGIKTVDEHDTNIIKGKWKLISRKFDPDTTFSPTPDSVVYHKIITDETFIWYYYDSDGKDIIGMAGGGYRLEGGSYTEIVEFHHPTGPNILGSSIPFKCEVIDDKWYHSGFINERIYDEEIDDYVVTAERRLEEIWERLE